VHHLRQRHADVDQDGVLRALARFANITGVTVPEFYSGVGDLPTGVYMTLGAVYTGDTLAAIFKARCVLVWMANPAVTRIPDAHFFWEARYNGTEVIAISPEFTPTAMHSSLWANPKPGTDLALAMAFVSVILEEQLYKADYIREQTDLPFLVRLDTREFLRGEDRSLAASWRCARTSTTCGTRPAAAWCRRPAPGSPIRPWAATGRASRRWSSAPSARRWRGAGRSTPWTARSSAPRSSSC
jgi:nitrate reductase alpha subunit